MTIGCVQVTPGNKMGIGSAICFSFQAHGFEQAVNEQTGQHDFKYTGAVKYDFKRFLKQDMTEEELMRQSPTMYCLMQCNKIGWYMKLVHNMELLRMNVEFHID